MKEKIKAFFERNNWKYIDNGSVLKPDVDGDGITWYAFFKVDQTDNFACFWCFRQGFPQSAYRP